jgi:hypothetical protein
VTLVHVAFATAASAAGPTQAQRCSQMQYHGRSQAESALRLKREAGTDDAVSRLIGPAVSPKRAISILVPIYGSILTQNCRSIVPKSATQEVGYPPAKVLFNPGVELEKPQYQSRRVRYQPQIAAVATNSAQAGENLRGRALMIKIGLLLGMAYLVFLMLWFWATRVRPRPTRAGRSIDTRRRIE